LADRLDDPAPPPLTTETHPYRGVARGGAALFPGDARPGAAGVRDGIAHGTQYIELMFDESRLSAASSLACPPG
jgi:hypothetical protein